LAKFVLGYQRQQNTESSMQTGQGIAQAHIGSHRRLAWMSIDESKPTHTFAH